MSRGSLFPSTRRYGHAPTLPGRIPHPALEELFRRFHTCFYAQQHTTESRFKLYFPPLLEVRPSDLTRPVIMQWFHEIGRHSHMQANHALSLLRTMFTKAEEWQLWDGDNPAGRIRWCKKDSRTRFIQPEEMPKLLE